MTVYTCTMNLAIDLFIETPTMLPNKVNRTNRDDVQANGKGVNVSLVMKQLGIDTVALGFSGGFTGRFIADCLNEKNIRTDFVEVPGMTRINVFTKVIDTGREYKLVNAGPIVSFEQQERLLAKIKQLKEGDILVVSGSLPRGVETNVLRQIAQICQMSGVKLVLDSSDKIVLDCLEYHPYLLKPNDEELSDWFGQKTIEADDILKYTLQLVEGGARNVLVSLGDKGALFVDEDRHIYRCNAPKGEVINTACAGDTLLATFLAGLIHREPVENVLRKSVAAGSSTAFRSGITDFSDVDDLEKQIIVKQMEV